MTSHLRRHSYVNFKLLNFPIFYAVFERTIQRKSKAEKNFEYLKYELINDILNLDKFGAQKRDTSIKSWIIERLDRKLADAIVSNIVEKCDVTLSRAIQPHSTFCASYVSSYISLSLSSTIPIGHVLK